MDRISRFVLWICSKFDPEQIERIISELQDILANRNPEVKPKDDFKKNIPTTATTTSTPTHHSPRHRSPKKNPH